MYDRKTWIVVVACSILLAVNLYYQQKDRVLFEQHKKEQAVLQAAEEAKKKAAAPQTPTPESEKPALVEMPPPVQDVEQLATLETSEAIFVFTNIGGGLKYAELKNQSPGIEGPVRLNRHGSHP